MNREFLDYIEDILDAMKKSIALLDGVEFATFENEYRINFAVVRALEIIGEATKRLPNPIPEQYSEIPWKEMAGMRDRIAHGYDNVNYQVVWDTVKIRIPELLPKINQILTDFNE